MRTRGVKRDQIELTGNSNVRERFFLTDVNDVQRLVRQRPEEQPSDSTDISNARIIEFAEQNQLFDRFRFDRRAEGDQRFRRILVRGRVDVRDERRQIHVREIDRHRLVVRTNQMIAIDDD